MHQVKQIVLSRYKSSIRFNDPQKTLAEGIIAVGGDVDVGTLIHAYAKGIFPWPQEGYPMLWFSPERRGIIDFNDFHVSESLKKFKRKNVQLKFTENKAFSEVIRQCQLQPRPGQEGTWINQQMIDGYLELSKAGYTLSIECWDGAKLVGGIYGVLLGRLFAAESMFYKKSNASKLCLWYLIEYLQTLGHTWMDIQMVTPVSESFGAKYVLRSEFQRRLKETQFEFIK